MKLALALFATLMIGGVATPSSAQVIPASQVLADCPDVPAAQACPGLAKAFLGNRAPSARRDTRIVNLVVAIAEAAQQPSVPRRACLNAADGLRVLAVGVTKEEQATQINDIADALCIKSRTASTGQRRLFDFFSLSSQSSSGGGGDGTSGGNTPTTPTVITRPSECTTDCSPPPVVTGTLGSHGAAKSPNENALDNANFHAKENTSGQNDEEHGNSQQQQQLASTDDVTTSSEPSPSENSNKPATAGPPADRGGGNPH